MNGRVLISKSCPVQLLLFHLESWDLDCTSRRICIGKEHGEREDKEGAILIKVCQHCLLSFYNGYPFCFVCFTNHVVLFTINLLQEPCFTNLTTLLPWYTAAPCLTPLKACRIWTTETPPWHTNTHTRTTTHTAYVSAGLNQECSGIVISRFLTVVTTQKANKNTQGPVQLMQGLDRERGRFVPCV